MHLGVGISSGYTLFAMAKTIFSEIKTFLCAHYNLDIHLNDVIRGHFTIFVPVQKIKFALTKF